MSTSLGPTLGSLLDIPPPESQFSDLARALLGESQAKKPIGVGGQILLLAETGE
jgi:hypothetical protein